MSLVMRLRPHRKSLVLSYPDTLFTLHSFVWNNDVVQNVAPHVRCWVAPVWFCYFLSAAALPDSWSCETEEFPRYLQDHTQPHYVLQTQQYKVLPTEDLVSFFGIFVLLSTECFIMDKTRYVGVSVCDFLSALFWIWCNMLRNPAEIKALLIRKDPDCQGCNRVDMQHSGASGSKHMMCTTGRTWIWCNLGASLLKATVTSCSIYNPPPSSVPHHRNVQWSLSDIAANRRIPLSASSPADGTTFLWVFSVLVG